MPIKSFLDLEVYQIAHQLAMKIFALTKSFPPEEKYSLTDQVRRASRSIAVLIAEGWGKRTYINNFKKYVVDSNDELEETKSWLFFSKNCGYLSKEHYMELITGYEVLGGNLWRLHGTWKDFS